MRIRHLRDQVQDLYMFSANPQQRIRTGLKTLDALTRGPAPGEVYTILGRSYSGKSIVAQNIIAANVKASSVFFSLEMPVIMAVQRLFSIWSGFEAQDVSTRTEQNNLPPLIDEMPNELGNHVIVDTPSLSIPDMILTIEEYTDMFGHRPAFVVIDYLELVSGAKVSGEGWQGTESQAQQVKDFAKTMNLPVFLLHQTNKSEPEWEPPTMGSARGGGYTEADFVVGMWRPYLDPKLPYYDAEAIREEVHFTILKNRPFGAHNNHPIRVRLGRDLRLREIT